MVLNGRKIGWRSASAIVIANMVGTGVFTSLGFQLTDLQNTWSILLLWILGGLVALMGALSYSELGTHLKRSGGEYHFVSQTINSFAGYLSGWVSLTVGFAAPIALAAMGVGAYLSDLIPVSGQVMAISIVLLLSFVHSISIKQSSRFQDAFTLIKVLLMIGLIVLGFSMPNGSNALEMGNGWINDIQKPAFAVCLVYVTYAYSGWSAAAYIVDEIKAPKKNLPIALIGGTSLVVLLYVALQLAFLNQAPLWALKGKVEIGQVVAQHMFGGIGAQSISILIALFLISSVSAMIWVGPRVTRAMADDYPLWQFLGKDNTNGIPVRAILFQATISISLILSGSFEQVLLYSGFLLQLCSMLAVIGVFVLRRNKVSNGYKSPFYPWPQIIYLAVSTWIVVFMVVDKPQESLWGLLNLGIGALTFFVGKYWKNKQWNPNAANAHEKAVVTPHHHQPNSQTARSTRSKAFLN